LKQKRLDSFFEKAEFFPDKLEELKKDGFDPWYAIRTYPHINETMWENYELMGIDDMPEQLMLKEAEKRFVDVFKALEMEVKVLYATKRKKSNKNKKPRKERVERKRIRSKKTRTIESDSGDEQPRVLSVEGNRTDSDGT
jgi:AAA15 family ATPase/GTPase